MRRHASGPPALPLCTSPVTIVVGPGLAPQFHWGPDCRVEFLHVERADVSQWAIVAGPSERRQIAPGVRYGVVPSGTLQLSLGAPPALQAGRTYVVSLIVNESPGGDVVVGRAEFVP